MLVNREETGKYLTREPAWAQEWESRMRADCLEFSDEFLLSSPTTSEPNKIVFVLRETRAASLALCFSFLPMTVP